MRVSGTATSHVKDGMGESLGDDSELAEVHFALGEDELVGRSRARRRGRQRRQVKNAAATGAGKSVVHGNTFSVLAPEGDDEDMAIVEFDGTLKVDPMEPKLPKCASLEPKLPKITGA